MPPWQLLSSTVPLLLLILQPADCFLSAPVQRPSAPQLLSSSAPQILGPSAPQLLSSPARRPFSLKGALSDSQRVEDLETFALNPPQKKLAAVYTVFSEDDEAMFVGITRDVHRAIAKHLTTQPPTACHRASIETFERPTRDALGAVQEAWLKELGSVPEGNQDPKGSWAKPALSDQEAEKKLKLRQAAADETLRFEDPEAWNQVVQKAMKDGDFDGSEADKLDQDIDADAEATSRGQALKRAAGDWQEEVERQTAETLSPPLGTIKPSTLGSKPPWQSATLEMFSAPGCPHCDRMRSLLDSQGVCYSEFNVENPGPLDDDQKRRVRHALFNTVPQLYVLREPPLHGLEPEWLVGGAKELGELMEIPEGSGFSFKARIGDPSKLLPSNL